MWLKLHLPGTNGSIEPTLDIVNMDRVREVRPEAHGSSLVFDIKADGSVDQVRVIETQDTIQQMLGVEVFITNRTVSGERLLSEDDASTGNPDGYGGWAKYRRKD